MSAPRILFLLASLVMYTLVWYFIYPQFQYMMDADAVGYLTIAHRVANHDWHRSINGLWSPLNSWLLVPFIKAGYNDFKSALALNFFFGGAVIILLEQFLHRFVQHDFYKKIILITIPIVIVYYSYLQVFGDLLQLVFVLIYLWIATNKNFFGNKMQYIFCGIIMAIAYYAKAYSLPFFILHFTVIHAWHWYQTKQFYFAKYILAIGVCILCILPWAMQLQSKYGQFSLMGNAGKLNMSWYLLSHKTFTEDIKILIPPTYNDSPSFWEDPYLSQGKLSSPTESISIFARWIARIIHTCTQAVGCINEISGFVLLIILLSVFLLMHRQKVHAIDTIIFATVLVPIGYLTMHIETRYIWLMMVGTVILAGVLVQKLSKVLHQKIAIFIFCFSLIAYPIFHLEDWRGKGKSNFELAQILKTNQIINKKIISNSTDGGNLWVASYLSQNQYYTIENFDFTAQEIDAEIKKYGIAYYINLQENGTLPIPDSLMQNKIFANQNFTIYQLSK
jgi:hypothetical protein